MKRNLIPLGIFVVLAGFFAWALQGGYDPRQVPSPLIDKPAPAFAVPQLAQADKTIARDDLKGQVWLLNVWASWCVSCRQEHPVLVALAKSKAVPIYGLNYKDQREAGLKWLAEHGDPYVASAFDADGRVGIDFGVYGVPETFLIDKNGVIRHKHIGPLTAEALRDTILPKVKELDAAS